MTTPLSNLNLPRGSTHDQALSDRCHKASWVDVPVPSNSAQDTKERLSDSSSTYQAFEFITQPDSSLARQPNVALVTSAPGPMHDQALYDRRHKATFVNRTPIDEGTYASEEMHPNYTNPNYEGVAHLAKELLSFGTPVVANDDIRTTLKCLFDPHNVSFLFNARFDTTDDD